MKNFNNIAQYYDTLACIIFRNTIKKSQLYFINKIPYNANVLIIGGGTGWYLYELLKTNKCKKIYYVEASSEMTNLSKKKISTLSYNTEIEFIVSPIEILSVTGQFDVVITNYVLDVFKKDKLQSVMDKLFSSLTSGGLWLFSDFRINSSPFHKYWQVLLSKAMYLFFRLTSGVENNKLLSFEQHFAELPLAKIYSRNFFSGMIESSVYKK